MPSSFDELVLDKYDDGAGDRRAVLQNGNGDRGMTGLNGFFITLAKALGEVHG